MHESLEIIECVDDNYEILDIIKCGNSYRNSIVKVYKLYKCKCHLCGKEQNIKSSDFKIKNDDSGIKAKIGYYSDVYCDCHKISSFQWRTIAIFKEHDINYKAEVSFPELVGDKNLLRYDFAIFNTDGSIKCLIECQGQQHYEPVEEFGGKSRFEYQQRCDTLKRDYAKRNNLPLVEIPYTCNTYEKELKFMQTHKVISVC